MRKEKNNWNKKIWRLALPDSNGEIRSIHQLFGDNTVGPDGQKAADGFAALAKYDDNRDGLIISQDRIYDKLVLWADRDSDGQADHRQIISFSSTFSEIDLGYVSVKPYQKDSYGNETRLRSVARDHSGNYRVIFDIWFRPIPVK